MTAAAPHAPAAPEAPPPAAPAASLAGIRIRPRPGTAPKPAKSGDITARLAAAETAAVEARTVEPRTTGPQATEPQVATPPTTPPDPPTALAPQPEPRPPVAAPLRERRRADDLVAYWEGLRHGRRLPALDDLDREAVAFAWPDSLLLSVAAARGAEPGIARVARLGELTGDIEYTPMVTEWLLSLGRRAAGRGERIDAVESFPLSAGTMRYRLLLFPLAAFDGTVEHVLCHLCRAPGGERSERRGWFRA